MTATNSDLGFVFVPCVYCGGHAFTISGCPEREPGAPHLSAHEAARLARRERNRRDRALRDLRTAARKRRGTDQRLHPDDIDPRKESNQ